MILLKQLAKKTIVRVKSYLVCRPVLKAAALRLLSPFPGVVARLKRVSVVQVPPVHLSAAQGPEQLSPRARQIYYDLKAAIEQRQKEQN